MMEATIVIACVLLLALAVLLLRLGRFGSWPGRRAGHAEMAVLERASLTPQHGVHLVRVRDRVLLVATCPGSTTLLHAFPADGPTKETES
jgi:flagellar biogenesis protein FliO